jgi:hypothetical protein
MREHPLMQYLPGLQDIRVSDGFAIDFKDLPPRTPRLLEGERDNALMFALSRQTFADVVLTFAIIDDNDNWITNWPQQISFPLLLRNLLYVLGNVSDAAGEPTLQPGMTKIRPTANKSSSAPAGASLSTARPICSASMRCNGRAANGSSPLTYSTPTRVTWSRAPKSASARRRSPAGLSRASRATCGSGWP